MYRCIQQQHENPNSTEKSRFSHGPDSMDMTHGRPCLALGVLGFLGTWKFNFPAYLWTRFLR